MKKLVGLLMAVMTVVGFVGLECGTDEPVVELEVPGDSIMTAEAWGNGDFEFDITNLTDAVLDISITVDSTGIPQGWGYSLCDNTLCYNIFPLDTTLAANTSWGNGLHMIINSDDQSTEGKIIVKVTSGEEVHEQSFTLQIQ